MKQSKWTDFETNIKKLMEDEPIAGAAVAVSQAGKTIYQKGFGVRDLNTNEPVTPETIFGTASVTKSFTAMAILRLEEEGELSIDDPVIRYLPEFKLHGVTDMRIVKIRHLLSHTTGLLSIRRNEELTRLEEHLNYLTTEQYEILGKPGEFFSYCNDTFLLLGLIIERLTGRLYRKYITEEILAPLGMHKSTFNLEEVLKFHNVTVPYDYSRKTKKFQRVSWPKLGNYEVGGGIRSNVLDLLKYGQLFVGHRSGFVRQAQVKTMWQPVHRIGRNEFYGYALKTTPDYSGITLVEHPGGQPGVSSNFGFVPEKELVAAVLTNTGGIPADDIWLKAVNTALGLPIEQKRSIEPYYQPSPEQLQRLTGTYTSAEGSEIKIFLYNGKVKIEVDNETFILRASDEQTLVIEKYNLPIRFFFKNNNDSPWAAFFGSRMLRRKQ